MTREELLKQTVLGAGKIVLEKFERSEVVYTKHDRLDLVTNADLEVNNFILGEIAKNFPGDGIVSEETEGQGGERECLWVVDPLDGTANFATGIPIFTVMIALIRKGEVQLSAIFDPVHNKLAFAKKGEGAVVNNQKIECSQQSKMADARGIMSFVVKGKEVSLRKKLIKKGEKAGVTMGVNAFGCAGFNAMCVAEGKRGWMVGFNKKLWDVAPSALLLAEAGCKVTNHQGEGWQPGMSLVAANKSLHQELIELVKEL